MTVRKIIGWLTLKDLPGVKAFTIGKIEVFGAGASFGKRMFTTADLLANPDFFLSICEGEEVCPACKGYGAHSLAHQVKGIQQCSTCNGSRKVAVKKEKLKCKICKGSGWLGYSGDSFRCPSCNGTGTQDWEWPPTVGQEVFIIDCAGEIFQSSVDAIKNEFSFYSDKNSDNSIVDYVNVYPTREMAEDYLKWRKGRGI